MIASVGLVIGPLLGGFLVVSLGWRSIFWINIAPGIIAVILLLTLAPESKAAKQKPFDPVGQIALVGFLVPLVFVIIELTALGWSSPLILGAIAICVLSLVLLVLYERPRPEALIPFRLFSSRAFTTSLMTLILGTMGIGATLFTVTLFLQDYRGLTPLEAGFFTLPMAIASMVAAPVSARFVGENHVRGVLLFAAIMIVTAGITFWVTADAIVWLMMIPFFFLGLGFGSLNDPISVVAISELPDSEAGLATSLISMGRQVGQVLGVAIAGALLSVGLGTDLATHLGQAATSVWVLLLIAGVGIFLLNVMPAGRKPPGVDAAGRTTHP